jgi:hypothetical protein
MVSPRFRRQVKYAYGLVKNLGQRCCKLQCHNEVAPGVSPEKSELE